MGFSEHDHFKILYRSKPYTLLACKLRNDRQLSKEFDDVGRAVASSVPTYLGKIKATLLTGYYIGVFLLAEWLYSRSTAI